MVTVLEGKFGNEASDATGTDVVYQIFLFGGMQQTQRLEFFKYDGDVVDYSI